MSKPITYSAKGITETIPSDAVMSLEQFSRYHNNFGPNYFAEERMFLDGRSAVDVYRGHIKEAWGRFSDANTELVARIAGLYNDRRGLYGRHLGMVKTGAGDDDPQLQQLEAEIREFDGMYLPILYEAYLALQADVKDNEILFR